MTKKDKYRSKIKYQPFLLAITLIGIVAKVISSISAGKPIFDMFFCLIILIFLTVVGVYIWEGRRKTSKKIKISTGDARDSSIIGLKNKGELSQNTQVDIKAKNIKGTKITGVNQKEKK